MTALQLAVIVAVTAPALGFALWPLRRGGLGAVGAAASNDADDRRLELGEEKAAIYRALTELDFDHEAGHLSDDDHRGLRNRYESRAGQILTALDALGPARSPAAPTVASDTAPAKRSWTRHPATLTVGALLVLGFGVAIGTGVSRYTEPDQTVTPPGSRLPVPVGDAGSPVGPPVAGVAPGKPIPPEILKGMLSAARGSLLEGRYSEAIAAYQAVLKRDARNVDALTHLGLIVAIGGHADAALETFDKALAIDPRYPPAFLYRGQVLYEVKRDYPGAVTAWERFLALVPSGEEHDRVAALVAEAKGKQRTR